MPRMASKVDQSGFANVIGVDDGPRVRPRAGATPPRDVGVVGTIYADDRLDGLVRDKLRRDGRNSTSVIARLVTSSRFDDHIQCVLLQGITFGGFNVVDLHGLAQSVARPVIAVSRHRPNMARIERALRTKVPGGARKWALIEKAGPPEACGDVFIQRAGVRWEAAAATIRRHTRHGHLPEPIRVAHILAGGIAKGASRGGA